MLQLIKNNHILLSGQALQLNLDEANKTLIFEKGGLIFVFNFHVFNSIPDYEFMVPEPGKYQIVLSSDNPKYGGWGRVDESIDHFSYSNPASGLSYLRIYNINRAVIVFKKSD